MAARSPQGPARPVRRVALLPLDERPCNYRYPQLLGPVARVEVEVPPAGLMGLKKRPADTAGLAEWLRDAAARSDAVVVAAETLVFGGLIPSRVTELSEPEAVARLSLLRELRQSRPSLLIHVQGVILRMPSYDSDDEEPPYWATFGRRMALYSMVLDATQQGPGGWESARRAGFRVPLPPELASLDFEGLQKKRAQLEAEIPSDVRQDWQRRRARNHRVNRELARLAGEGVIDFLALIQDDSPPLGLHAREQRALARLVADLGAFRRVVLYPGADETGLVLLARHVLRGLGLRPRFSVRFSSTEGPHVVPKYEDRPLLEGVKGQITALGGLLQLAPDCGGSLDIALFVNSPDGPQSEAPFQHLPGEAVGSGRSLAEVLEALAAGIQSYPDRPAALADLAYANGADRALIEMLPAYVWPLDLAAYAGWNTAGNSLGTALAHAALRWAAQRTLSAEAEMAATRAHHQFLCLRFAEDWAYQAEVRQEMVAGPVAALGISPYSLGEHRSRLASEALSRLHTTFGRWLGAWKPYLAVHEAVLPDVRFLELEFPWDRLFEVSLTVRLGGPENDPAPPVQSAPVGWERRPQGAADRS